MPEKKEKKTVLIVDDNGAVSGVLREILEPTGLAVSCCGEGYSALELSEKKCFDVIITDYRMPGMTGADIARLLRAQCPDALIIGISAGHKDKEFIEAGADVFLKKPFPFRDLVSMIQEKMEK